MKRILLMLGIAAFCPLASGEPAGATFKEGVGVQLGEPTRAAIGLDTAVVEERRIGADIRLTAQVYREAGEASQNQGEPRGFAYASAWIEASMADLLPPGTEVSVEGHPDASASVLRVDRTAAAHGGRAELLLRIQDPAHSWRIGDFVLASPTGINAGVVTVIPTSAVLDTAYGPFAYVVNGHAYLRTAVRLGAREGGLVEVLDGLYSGDEVVTRPVETLYLIELRATKGGGHSH